MMPCAQQSDFFHRNGDTALFGAVLKNNVEMVTFLLDHEADINAKNKYDE
jgi:ankyrin repeat protein